MPKLSVQSLAPYYRFEWPDGVGAGDLNIQSDDLTREREFMLHNRAIHLVHSAQTIWGDTRAYDAQIQCSVILKIIGPW